MLKKQKIKTEDYVNKNTGETLESEIGIITSVNVFSSDEVYMKSKSFLIVEKEALEFLEQNLSRIEMSYIYSMCRMARGDYNILYDTSRVPHSKKTLMGELELARNAFNRLMSKLLREGVIYYLSGYVNKKEVKHIMLNPHLARSTNKINSICYKAFTPLSKKSHLSLK